ncbi:MAG: UDP-N-acetylmuramoyl-L-alanine--D-glutamate ligase [Planctomycetota bacterium]
MSQPKVALVLGLGRFGGGVEATRFLLRRGRRVRVADRAAADQLSASVEQLPAAPGLELCLGREDPGLLDHVDLLVVNPGVAPQHPLLVEARRHDLAVTQEVDLFLAAYPGRVTLVTGTNGKSTTATLLAAALRAAGRSVLVGGNLGHSLLADEASWSPTQDAIVEISSFQLERLAPTARVHGTVLTAVTRDHLDRHRTLQAYHAAKATAAAAAQEFLVHPADDPVTSGFATAAKRRVTFARRPPRGDQTGVIEGWLVVGASPVQRLLHRDALTLLGGDDFQLDNVMAAAAAATLLGAAPHAAGLALAMAAPLPHRLQLVRVTGGVRIYDNGVSTEVQSTAAALRSLRGAIRWVGGGHSKDGDYASVADAIAARAASAHVYGRAATPLRAALGARCPCTTHETLRPALDAAWRAAQPGDALLFSPAFASFDQYPNFRARAEEFCQWVAAEPAGRGAKQRAPVAPDLLADA